MVNKRAYTLVGRVMQVAIQSKKTRFAFTLAEILITLGIIGVVAAITIPTLFKKINDIVTVNKLKKSLAEVNQAYRLASTETELLSEEELLKVRPIDYFNTYWRPYFKVSYICETGVACGYSSDEPFKSKNGTTNETRMTPNANVSYVTNSGFFYLFQPRAGMDGTIAQHTILVDLNGRKGPNTFCKDVFVFRISSDGTTFMPVGYSLSNDKLYKNDTCGDYCAEKIRRAGWKIPANYP